MRILKWMAISAVVVLAACSSSAKPQNTGEPATTPATTTTTAATTTTIPGTPPGAAQHVSAASIGNGVVRLFWRAPTNHGSYPVSAYLVTPFAGSKKQTTKAYGSAATEQSMAGLSNGHSYTFEVAAVSAAGAGPFSARSGPVIVGSPGIPQNVKAAKAGAGSLRVSFKAPGDSGSPITSYTAACKPSNGGAAKSRKGPAGPITVNGLTSGTAYRCTVRATNKRGTGPLSQPSNAVTV